MTMVIFTASAIVRERERGNLELLITTPVSPGQLMAGNSLPYVVIGLIQTTLILVLRLTGCSACRSSGQPAATCLSGALLVRAVHPVRSGS